MENIPKAAIRTNLQWNINAARMKRSRLSKARTLYYANTVCTLRLLLSNDIEVNPGPTKTTTTIRKAPKCPKCEKTIRSNSKQVSCCVCQNLYHLNCSAIRVSNKQSVTPNDWICTNCVHTVLPFLNVRSLDDTCDFDASLPNENILVDHLQRINEHRNNISIAHLNTQSIASTFDAFHLMINKYKFDILAVTETWLKGSVHQYNYVQVEGYETFFRNREGQRGGGVGFYIKDNIVTSERKDFNKLDQSIEHQWIEVRGRNKNTPYLVGVMYQPSSDENIKLDWLEKLDSLLSKICVKWNGVIILTGDYNIDLLA